MVAAGLSSIFRNLKIRTKLLLVYTVFFLITIIVGSLAVYVMVRENIEKSIEKELENSTDSLRNMVNTAVTTAVKIHLRGILERKRLDIQHIYSHLEKGEISEAEAKQEARDLLLADTIGKTGYFFVWDIMHAPESIPLAVHPYIEGEDVANVDFVQAGAALKNGYIEYDWKNPQEVAPRKKSMYLAYFAPWNWVIAAASYREEFLDLVNIEDLREFIMPLKFGKSGYAYIIDTQGNIILHPFISGNFLDARDAEGALFVREMCARKNGRLSYFWKNPGETEARKKLTVYRYISEYGWIVAGSSYYDEFFSPLRKLKIIIGLTVLGALILLLPLTFRLSSMMTRQIRTLVNGFAKGSSGDFSIRLHPKTYDEIGELTRYFNVFMEKLENYGISLRNEIEAKDQASARLEVFKKFAEAAGQGFLMTDLNGIITYANPGICGIIGCDGPEEILDTSIFNYYAGVLEGLLDKEIRPVLKQRNTWTGELSLRKINGGIVDVIQNIFLLRDNAGKARLFATVITDITERKRIETLIHDQKARIEEQFGELAAVNRTLVRTRDQLESSHQALSREKELLSITLSSITDGVITTDRKGGILTMNPAAAAIIGPKAAVGILVQEALPLFRERDGELLENPVMRAMTTGAVAGAREDVLIMDAQGNRKFLRVTAAPLYDAPQSIFGAVLALQDMTERRAMEKELVKIMKIESLGVFAGGIAHDFNNLLTAIMGNISLAMQLGENDEKISGVLESALNASLNARELTQQLLTFSKGGEPVIAVESIGAVLVQAADFIMSGSEIQVWHDIPADLWNGKIDRGQFNQVVYNIFLNARQAMAGGGTLTCVARNCPYGERELPLEPGKYVKIDISDEGGGIPPDIIKNIFDPFFTTKENGSGLGLAVAFSVVQKHGGHISVSSVAGKGSTFTIYIPASTEKVAPADAPDVAGGFGGGRILVMDDDDSVADIALQMIRHLGFEADRARDGAEAIECYASALAGGDGYRAVIMDLTIPGGMGGRDAVQRIRKMDPAAVVLVSSGYSNDPVMADFHAFGFNGVLSKPYLLDELRRVLLRYLAG